MVDLLARGVEREDRRGQQRADSDCRAHAEQDARHPQRRAAGALAPLLVTQLGLHRLPVVRRALLVLRHVLGFLPRDEARQVALALHLQREVVGREVELENDFEVLVRAVLGVLEAVFDLLHADIHIVASAVDLPNETEAEQVFSLQLLLVRKERILGLEDQAQSLRVFDQRLEVWNHVWTDFVAFPRYFVDYSRNFFVRSLGRRVARFYVLADLTRE